MAQSKRMSVQKRLRERKKAEAAALKREERNTRGSDEPSAGGGGAVVAERADLEGYGVLPGPGEETDEV